MNVFVYGNCQAASYGAALGNLVATDTVYVAGRDSYDTAADCDIIFVQSEFWHQATAPGGLLPITNQRLIRIPTFYFAGLAPDAILERCNGRALTCPAGVYNSSIALHGFLRGFSVDETLALFNEKTYATLAFDSYWAASRQALIADLDDCGIDGARTFEAFLSLGKFACSPHHPVLGVFEAIVRGLMRRHDLPPARTPPSCADPMIINGDWPVYPGILPSVAFPRSYDFCFDPPPPGTMIKSPIPLKDFVRRSFADYAALPPGSITSERLSRQADLYAQVVPPARRPTARRRHVYADLPQTSYWKAAVGTRPVAEVDPVVQTKWRIGAQDRIATAGSCFAQHIARTLVANGGGQFLDCEPAPAAMTSDEAARRHFGLFSARYGNIYSARQLYQLVARAIGTFSPVDAVWQRPDGRFIDPFRPQIEPDGFASATEVIADTDAHLRAILAMLEAMDVFIFTLGLTEAWASTIDGAVYPVAPGIVAGDMDRARYRFLNFTASQVRADLRRALDLMRDINPRLRVILTVSPVPLVATYESRHVLVSTTYSKSALRVAAGETVADLGFVDYFPSYEMIAGPHTNGCYFEADKRSVSREGVQHVMARFQHHYLGGERVPAKPAVAAAANPIAAEIAARSRYMCDEEALDRPNAVDDRRLHYAQTYPPAAAPKAVPSIASGS